MAMFIWGKPVVSREAYAPAFHEALRALLRFTVGCDTDSGAPSLEPRSGRTRPTSDYAVFYGCRGKGGKQGHRELPRRLPGRAVTTSQRNVHTNLRRQLKAAGLPPSGVHIFRHSAAKLRRDAGESVQDVSHFLDHSSLAVTSVYLRRLEGVEDRGWARVAEAIGVASQS